MSREAQRLLTACWPRSGDSALRHPEQHQLKPLTPRPQLVPYPVWPIYYYNWDWNLNLSTVEWPGALSPVLNSKGDSEVRGRGVHSPEPGRDISLGSSQIPRICVLWEKRTGLTVAPDRPAGSRAPGPPPHRDLRTPQVLVQASRQPRSPVHWLRKVPQRSARGGWAAARGAGTSATRDQSAASAPPGPTQGGPSGGGGPPAAPAPTAGPMAERLPSEWSSLNIHFMAAAAAGKGCSRLSEPQSSAHQPQQRRRRRRRQR